MQIAAQLRAPAAAFDPAARNAAAAEPDLLPVGQAVGESMHATASADEVLLLLLLLLLVVVVVVLLLLLLTFPLLSRFGIR